MDQVVATNVVVTWLRQLNSQCKRQKQCAETVTPTFLRSNEIFHPINEPPLKWPQGMYFGRFKKLCNNQEFNPHAPDQFTPTRPFRKKLRISADSSLIRANKL